MTKKYGAHSADEYIKTNPNANYASEKYMAETKQGRLYYYSSVKEAREHVIGLEHIFKKATVQAVKKKPVVPAAKPKVVPATIPAAPKWPFPGAAKAAPVPAKAAPAAPKWPFPGTVQAARSTKVVNSVNIEYDSDLKYTWVGPNHIRISKA